MLRGSVYANQELAVALAFGFEKHMILLNNRKVEPEGVLSFLVSNTEQFSRPTDILRIPRKEVFRAGWDPLFSRQLQIIDCRVDDPVPYCRPIGGMRRLRIAHLVLRNARDDLTARGCVARLLAVQEVGSPERQSPDPTR